MKIILIYVDAIWGPAVRPGSAQESALMKALGLRDALAGQSARLRAAAEYAHAAVRLLDDAMPAWKITTVGKSVLFIVTELIIYIKIFVCVIGFMKFVCRIMQINFI